MKNSENQNKTEELKKILKNLEDEELLSEAIANFDYEVPLGEFIENLKKIAKIVMNFKYIRGGKKPNSKEEYYYFDRNEKNTSKIIRESVIEITKNGTREQISMLLSEVCKDGDFVYDYLVPPISSGNTTH